MIVPAHKYTCEPARSQYVLTDVHFPEFQEWTLAKITSYFINKLILPSCLKPQGVHLLILVPNLTWVCKSCTRSLASRSSCSATLLLLSVCSKVALSSSISACNRLALRSTIASCSLRSSWLLMASSKCSWVSYTKREKDSYSCSNESKYKFRVMHTQLYS